MLDLKKYLRRASADPGFRARLLKNANQAIKNEFGEDLPYKLKCKEKIVFEVEATDGVAESDLEGVAGGGFWSEWPRRMSSDDLVQKSFEFAASPVGELIPGSKVFSWVAGKFNDWKNQQTGRVNKKINNLGKDYGLTSSSRRK